MDGQSTQVNSKDTDLLVHLSLEMEIPLEQQQVLHSNTNHVHKHVLRTLSTVPRLMMDVCVCLTAVPAPLRPR